MIIDKDSLTINDVNMGNYIIQATFGYYKAWGDDTGRNTLSGNFSGTLKGIFPKITVQFKPMNQTEVEAIVPILDSATQSVSYYDPNKKQSVTMTTYSNDYEILCKNLMEDGSTAEGFSCAFIATKKRS